MLQGGNGTRDSNKTNRTWARGLGKSLVLSQNLSVLFKLDESVVGHTTTKKTNRSWAANETLGTGEPCNFGNQLIYIYILQGYRQKHCNGSLKTDLQSKYQLTVSALP